MNYEPQTELAKLLLVLTQEVGSLQPGAFNAVHVDNALKQADSIGGFEGEEIVRRAMEVYRLLASPPPTKAGT
jgi:hypothetical protein